MDRLTERNKDGGVYFPQCFAEDAPCVNAEKTLELCAWCVHEAARAEKLAAYEDTGLEPEEVRRLASPPRVDHDFWLGRAESKFKEEKHHED